MKDTSSELGELLKSARLGKGLCLKTLESKTSIRQNYLEAMESGNFRFLSHVYMNGFIQKVAETVELDMANIKESHPDVFENRAQKIEFQYGLSGIEERSRLSFIEAHAFFVMKILGSLLIFYVAFYGLKKFFFAIVSL